ncbi:MAG: complex I NDUFA9 subunit family protein [Verrucomicrobiota bacterium]
MFRVMILVTGGTGFVGRSVVTRLVEQGHSVRVLARSPELGERLQKDADCEIVIGDVLKPETLAPACDNVDAIIHLVGIIFEVGSSTFESVHVDGTRNMLRAAENAYVARFLHMSALGTRLNAPSPYHKTKWAAEKLVRESELDWTIFQPSVIYGKQDQFVSLFSALMEPPLSCLSLNTLPCPFNGKPLTQPVLVDRVAEAFVSALARQVSVGKTYELCGPQISLSNLLATLAKAKGFKPVELDVVLPAVPFFLPFFWIQRKHPIIVYVPGELARIGAWIVEHFSPIPILNEGQMLMLEENQSGDPVPASADLGVDIPSFEEGLTSVISS